MAVERFYMLDKNFNRYAQHLLAHTDHEYVLRFAQKSSPQVEGTRLKIITEKRKTDSGYVLLYHLYRVAGRYAIQVGKQAKSKYQTTIFAEEFDDAKVYFNSPRLRERMGQYYKKRVVDTTTDKVVLRQLHPDR